MSRMWHNGRSGFTLYVVLSAAFVSFAAIGSSLTMLANASRSVRFSGDRARARSLCEGAWRAAQCGLSAEGSSYSGFHGRELGGGEISVRIEKGAADGVFNVTVTGRIPLGSGECREVVKADVMVIDANPAGSRLGKVLSIR